MNPQQLSEQLCNKGKLACDWYHGNWHLLKSLGVVSTSAVHEQGICQMLKCTIREIKEPAILLTGSTDETLVRMIHATCKELGIKPKITAVDICATPLAFMESYASEKQIELRTCKSNILDFDTEEKFDVILTHAFMGYFNDTQRPLLIKKWQQLLIPRGSIITVQRIRPENSPAIVKFSEQQSKAFVCNAIETVKSSSVDYENEVESVKQAASKFTDKFISYAITSKATFEELFVNAGLSFHTLEYHRLETVGQLSGPSVPSDAEFAHVIAVKQG